MCRCALLALPPHKEMSVNMRRNISQWQNHTVRRARNTRLLTFYSPIKTTDQKSRPASKTKRGIHRPSKILSQQNTTRHKRRQWQTCVSKKKARHHSYALLKINLNNTALTARGAGVCPEDGASPGKPWQGRQPKYERLSHRRYSEGVQCENGHAT